MALIANIYDFLPLIALSLGFFQAVYYASYPFISLLHSNAKFWKPNTITSWRIHCVSFVHAAIASFTSISNFYNPDLVKDHLFGYSASCAPLIAISLGYFLWDSVICLRNVRSHGIGFVFHGVFCFCIYGLSFTPFLMYFAIRFLIFEVSTIFLNFHWFMDKLGKSGGILHNINSLLLLSAFFFIRIIYGFSESLNYYRVMYENLAQFHPLTIAFLTSANVALNSLNVLWFSKMLRAAHRKFMVKTKKLSE